MNNGHATTRRRAWALLSTTVLFVLAGAGAGVAVAHDCTDGTCDTTTTTTESTTTAAPTSTVRPTTTTTQRPTTTTTEFGRHRPPPTTSTTTRRTTTTTTAPPFFGPPPPPPAPPAPPASAAPPARVQKPPSPFAAPPSTDPPDASLPVVTPAFPALGDHTGNSLVTARLASGGTTGDDWSIPWAWIGGGLLGVGAVAALLRLDRRWSRR